MNSKTGILIITLATLLFTSCKQDKAESLLKCDTDASLVHLFLDQLNKAIVNDIFSPPVASRIYAYSFLAGKLAYGGDKSFLSKSVRKIPSVAIDSSHVDPYLVALLSMQKVGSALVFSSNYVDDYRDSLDVFLKNENYSKEKLELSEAKATEIFDKVKFELMDTDGYAETRTMQKHELERTGPSEWIPTPPDYLDALEPHWSKIKPYYLSSANQFAPKLNFNFSTEKGSKFWTELEELYSFVKDSIDDERLEIAEFWDCNPFVTEHQGHYMKGVKKITPGGHWMGITSIVSQNVGIGPEETIEAFALLSTSLVDAFISCWDEKYRSNLVRPETLINLHIDPEWKPRLVTPSFPEYTSGHSVVSGTASTVLTYIFGDNIGFVDDTEVDFGLPIRSFKSFNAAADEAAVSRYYGGIHYKPAVYDGLIQGRAIATFILNSLDEK